MVDSNNYSFKKWIGLILFIKLSLFIFYAICFHLYPEVSLENGLLYVVGGDTFDYYRPLIYALNGDNYGNACRMPGLALPFAPFYLITQNEVLSYNLVVAFQFIVSTLSVYVLGLIANIVFNNNHRIFMITILLYSFWYHIGDHYLMADSIANTTLIFAVYFFLVSLKENFDNKIHILYSGVFFTWSIFSRLIAIVPFLALCFLIFYCLLVKQKKVMKFFTTTFLFVSCFLIFETAWVIRNKVSLDRLVVFTEAENCFSAFSYNWRELNKIPTAWGLETTHWVGEINWLLDKNSTASEFPFPKTCLTKSFNADSLAKLKNEYWLLQESEPMQLNKNFSAKISMYLKEYKSENIFRYYIVNPLKLLTKFYYKKTIVDMPFPALSEMNLFQKGFKAINWIFILVISMLFLLSPLRLIKNKDITFFTFVVVPFSISAFLVFFGAIEQRYFWAIIPFCVIFFAYITDYILTKFKRS